MVVLFFLTVFMASLVRPSKVSMDMEGEIGTGNFEADCTIIDKVKKLSRRLKLTSEHLDDEQLKIALAKTRRSTDKRDITETNIDMNAKDIVKKTGKNLHRKKAYKRKSSTNQTNRALPLKNNQNHGTPTTSSTSTTTTPSTATLTTITKSTHQEQSRTVILTNATSSPLLLSSCQYVDLTVIQVIPAPSSFFVYYPFFILTIVVCSLIPKEFNKTFFKNKLIPNFIG